jgi:hypothetical protein
VQTAIQAAQPGTHVASTSNEAVISGAVNLSDYDTVVWILGEESTADDTFNATEQTKVEQFIAAGGNLFVTGSEIAWDLDSQNNGRSFYENTLKGNYVADDANTYTVAAAAGGIFAGLPNMTFSNGSTFSSLDGQVYNVDFPDVISAQAGAQLALNYSGGTGGGAAIQVQGTGGRGSIVMFGFPFETITSAANRAAVMGRVLNLFAVEPPTPAVSIKTQVNGQEADAAPGVVLAPGTSATFTYTLTNAGNVPLGGVTVVDDHGTSGNAADDQSPSFLSGDSNGNGLLDPGEVWSYSLVHTIPTGQAAYVGSVSAMGDGQAVSASDAANTFGSAPAIGIQTMVNGQDANSPPGPSVNAGETVTFAYVVTNAGNISLMNVVVVDNNGTPGNAADDFNPTFFSGDTNSNGQLDLGESWVYLATRTAVSGQFSGTGTAVGLDVLNQGVLNSDAVNYLGQAPANADFNGDGAVDGADFLAWQVGVGSTGGGQAAGDANSDGAVDGADLAVWTSQFPQSSSDAVAAAAASSSSAALSSAAVMSSEESSQGLEWLAQRAAWAPQVGERAAWPTMPDVHVIAASDIPHLNASNATIAPSLTLESKAAKREQVLGAARGADSWWAAVDAACEVTVDWSWPDGLG